MSSCKQNSNITDVPPCTYGKNTSHRHITFVSHHAWCPKERRCWWEQHELGWILQVGLSTVSQLHEPSHGVPTKARPGIGPSVTNVVIHELLVHKTWYTQNTWCFPCRNHVFWSLLLVKVDEWNKEHWDLCYDCQRIQKYDHFWMLIFARRPTTVLPTSLQLAIKRKILIGSL